MHGIYIISGISVSTTSLKYVYVQKNENGVKSFLTKPEGKRPLERPWHRLEGIYLQDLGFEDVGCIQLAQDKGPMAGCYVSGNELSGSIKLRNFMAF